MKVIRLVTEKKEIAHKSDSRGARAEGRFRCTLTNTKQDTWMGRPAVNPNTVQFGLFEVDLQTRELRKSGMKIKLNDQPFQVLALLLERPGEIVTREELQTRLWPADTFVDFDLSLNSAVKKL